MNAHVYDGYTFTHTTIKQAIPKSNRRQCLSFRLLSTRIEFMTNRTVKRIIPRADNNHALLSVTVCIRVSDSTLVAVPCLISHAKART